MKILTIATILTISVSSFAAQQSLICTDSEFGAGHFKLVIPDTKAFFASRDMKPVAMGEFWVRGESYKGALESPIFMADWGDNSGWYRSSPAFFDFSMCNWKKCPVRKVKMSVHTKDQMKGEGTVKFLLDSNGVKEVFEKKLSCEIKSLL